MDEGFFLSDKETFRKNLDGFQRKLTWYSREMLARAAFNGYEYKFQGNLQLILTFMPLFLVTFTKG